MTSLNKTHHDFVNFRQFIGLKNYDLAQEVLYSNPKIKDKITKEEFRTMYDHLESQVYGLVVDSLKNANKDVVEMNKNLKKTLETIK